ncbi:hypothetical protein E2C01_072817 [Portunus trituberculatus]|uniref:Uncharacterized protein n=1 Tax=Portunus trituberculatus TaxID=210409 RepID=A0A5B7I7P7_PORTR|nr:hypothetical protein [Portunus trituberculatus]
MTLHAARESYCGGQGTREELRAFHSTTRTSHRRGEPGHESSTAFCSEARKGQKKAGRKEWQMEGRMGRSNRGMHL